VARLGGDEFTVVLQGVEDSDAAAGIARDIIETLAAPFVLGEDAVSVSASIGIALCPEDAEDPDALTNAADQAMYDAKAMGRNRYSLFADTDA
jgi:diguanylate cyclase (GGDEF)-like protein